MPRLDVERQLGRKVARLRRLAGLTQAELAEKVGVATETISRLETGAATPSIARMADIAQALGVELYVLFIVNERVSQRAKSLERLCVAVRRLPAADIDRVVDVVHVVFRRQ